MKRALLTAAALLAVASFSLADPQAGVPGNSDDHNPHGSPPGQGGEVPGNSGDHNPHGTPPGQRIPSVSPGSPTAPGTPAPSIPGSGPSTIAVPGATRSSVPTSLGGGRAAWFEELDARLHSAEQQDRLLREAGRLKGWEPGWSEFLERLPTARVRIATRLAASDGEIVARVTELWKAGDRRACRETWADGDGYEWRTSPPGGWFRRFGEAWQATGGAPPPPPLYASSRRPEEALLARCAATPVHYASLAGGLEFVGLVRHGGRGRGEWEVDEASGRVAAMRWYDASGHLESEETRRWGLVGGVWLPVARTSRRYEAPARAAQEALDWTVGPDALDDAFFAP